jgi:hypothetical protein
MWISPLLAAPACDLANWCAGLEGVRTTLAAAFSNTLESPLGSPSGVKRFDRLSIAIFSGKEKNNDAWICSGSLKNLCGQKLADRARERASNQLHEQTARNGIEKLR